MTIVQLNRAIVMVRDEGKSTVEIGRELSLKPTNVRRYLAVYSDGFTELRNQWKAKQADRLETLLLTMNVEDASNEIGMSVRSTRYLMRKHGIDGEEKRSRRRLIENGASQWVAEHLNDIPLRIIAKRHGVAPNTVLNQVNRWLELNSEEAAK